MKKYAVILFVMFLNIASYAGVPFEVYFEESNSSETQVEIDVKVRDFVDVFGFQIYIEWESSVLKFDKVSYTHSEMSGISFHDFDGGNVVSGGWSSITSAKTITDGATIFTIKFDYSGEPCDKTQLKVIDYSIKRKSLATYEVDTVSYEAPIRNTPIDVQIPGDDCDTTPSTDGFCLHIGEVTSPAGSSICVPITVDSFNFIGSLQFGVSWDTSIIAWKNEGFNLAKETDGMNVGTTLNSANNYYKYLLDCANPFYVDYGETLVELCFEVREDAQNGDFAVIQFSEDSIAFGVTDYEDNAIEWCGTPGKVIVGDVDRTVTFKASNETPNLGDEVCVDITAKQFKDIGSFQFMVNWDSDVIKYKGLGAVNNIDISNTHLNSADDENIRISWNKPEGITLDDDEILFQLCYDVVGECNSSTDFKIIDSDLWDIEVSSNNISLPHQEIFGSVQVKCNIVIDSVVVQHPTCPGTNDGFIKVYMQNPANYKFDWSHDADEHAPIVTGLAGGEYTVTITDKFDNSIQTEITRLLNDPSPLQVVADEIVDESCDTKGSIELEVFGLTPPYTFTWSNGATTESISNLDAGDYTITIEDKNNCGVHDFTYTVGTNIDEFKVSSNVTDIICHGSDDGSIELVVSGGCEPYTVAWSDGVQDQLVRSNLTANTYQVTVTDNRGGAITSEFTITNPAELLVEASISNGIPGAIDVTVTGGEAPYTYSWAGPNGFASTQEDINNLEEGNYVLQVTDSRGCVADTTFEVKGIIDNISVEVIVNTDINNGQGVKCNGECNGSIDAVITANAPWSVYLDDQLIQLPYNQVCGGDHTFKVVDDQNKTVEVTFNMPEPDPLIISPDVTCCDRNQKNGSIELSVSGGYGEYSFQWNGSAGEDSNVLNNLEPGEYSVLVTDENGCQALHNQIKVSNCYTGDCYEGSLILTPNGDGFNDFFLITCVEDFETNELRVFDRIGNEVYTQKNYDGTWNGVDEAGKPLVEDAYMWVFIGENSNGGKEVYKGTVTILRD